MSNNSVRQITLANVVISLSDWLMVSGTQVPCLPFFFKFSSYSFSSWVVLSFCNLENIIHCKVENQISEGQKLLP